MAIEESTVADLAHEVSAGRLHAAVGFQDSDLARVEYDGLRRVDIAEERFVSPERLELSFVVSGMS